MDELIKTLSPEEYHQQFLSKGIRSDGRHFDDFRPAVIQANVVSRADGSAMIRQGDSLIVASICAELGRPRQAASDRGRVELQIQQSGTKSDLGATGDEPWLTQTDVNFCLDRCQSLLDSGMVVDLKDLCIDEGKLCWVLRCDMVTLDGTPSMDACLTAVTAALNCATLPELTLKPRENIVDLAATSENGEKEEDEDDEDEVLFTPERIRVDPNKRKWLKLNETRPVASSFLSYRSMLGEKSKRADRSESDFIVLADPNMEEMKALGVNGQVGAVVVGENRSICGVSMLGGGSAFDDVFDHCLALADSRRHLINRLISEACAK